jgi:hypothetical protein
MMIKYSRLERSLSTRKPAFFASRLFAGAMLMQCACGGAMAADAAKPARVQQMPVAAADQTLSNQGVQFLKKDVSKDRLDKVLAETTVVIGGKRYPKAQTGETPAGRAEGGVASCNIGDVQQFTQGAAIDLDGAHRQAASYMLPPDGPMKRVYSPPNSDWVIQSYHRTVTSSGAPVAAGDSGVPGNYSYNSSGTYSSVNSSMHNYIATLNASGSIPGMSASLQAYLNAQVSSMTSNMSSYANSISASNSTVEHTAQVFGTGRFNTHTAHAWYHGYIDGTLTCSPAYLRDANALMAALQAWVNNYVTLYSAGWYVPVAGDVRLRHEATGQCLYAGNTNGASSASWTCWPDPAMAVKLEPLTGSDVRIRLQSTGKCLYADSANGAAMRVWQCWNDPGMVYVKEDLGNNRVRLHHKMTDKCMYATTNGGPVDGWSCWADPAMVWVVDPF